MVQDMDIWRSAASMVKAHGDNAPVVCVELMDRWAKRGDPEALETWRRIMEATRRLTECGSKGKGA